MACSSVEGASTLSEVRVVGLYQYIFVSSFPKRTMSLMFPVLRAPKHLPSFGGSVDRSYYPYWSAKGSSANFALTEFSEVRPQESRLLSGGRHRRGAAQRQSLLRGQDDCRVHTLHPPKLRRRPLLDGLLYGRRLDHELAGVDQLGEPLLLLQGCIQLDRLHPVEGGPNGAPLAALLLDEPPELFPAASAQGLFLRSHEQPSLPLQAPGLEAVSLEV